MLNRSLQMQIFHNDSSAFGFRVFLNQPSSCMPYPYCVCREKTKNNTNTPMKPRSQKALLVAIAGALAATPAFAADLVRDTFLDGNRNDPASPIYSEYGVDGDSDGDIESAWFRGGAGALTVSSGGPLRLTQNSTSSSSITTYFTAEGSEVTLANAGDFLKLTWQFSVSGTVGANTSQGLRVALVNSPSDARVSSEASPGDAAYAGYGLFLNMSPSLSHSRPLELMERNAGSAALLSAGAAWTGLASDGTSGNTGYVADTEYMLTVLLTRTAGGELDIVATMSGGDLNGVGQLSVSYTDTTPNSFAYDTFQFRPDGNDVAYDVFDTKLFRVELGQVPEPSVAALGGLALTALLARRRSSRS